MDKVIHTTTDYSIFDEVLNKNKPAKNKVFMSTDFQQRKYVGDNDD